MQQNSLMLLLLEQKEREKRSFTVSYVMQNIGIFF